MKGSIFSIALFVATFLGAGPSIAEEPKPLFANDETISIRIVAPFSELIRKAADSKDPYPASLTLLNSQGEETHEIELSARGKSRRDRQTCQFPPLRVAFNKKPDAPSLFDGQKRLKLVTHCKSSSRYQQYYVREYLAYKLLNVITPKSLRVRMANIDYVDSKKDKVVTTRLGFFIEDIDDAAKRNGMREVETTDVPKDALDAESAARYAVFQYMIGNLDWSMRYAVEGEECCHNTKLIGASKTAAFDLTPVPYDFDYSGLVDAAYAVPPEAIPVRSVRTRRYRGLCIHNDVARRVAAEMRSRRAEFEGVVASTDELSDRSRRGVLSYLDGFFADVADVEEMDRRLFSRCRK